MTTYFKRIFKIEKSQKNPFLYKVYRRNFSDKFILVAVVNVIPHNSYEITALKQIKPKELNYLTNEFRKIAEI